ncbi:hypothetical protein [Paraburkholderia sp. UYCP14C]|uniref:hypothetical protein n=1 Tax=Paraburkholderia sp. UYCP14C TaxID=2511130 RepID=UPI001459FE39|nr:hypothetical protein [Paraburkholderia sp. UYCP14C]
MLTGIALRNGQWSARSHVRAILAGERAENVIRALTGNWVEEHLFVLAQALAMFCSLS